jgi:hypothetical protein
MDRPVFVTFIRIGHHFHDFSSYFVAKSDIFRKNTNAKTFISTYAALAPGKNLMRGSPPTTVLYAAMQAKMRMEKIITCLILCHVLDGG